MATKIKLNNTLHTLYSLADIKEGVAENLGEPFSYAAYSGALEAHYTLLYEFVERLTKEAERLEITKDYNRLIDERAKQLVATYKGDFNLM